MPSSPPANSRRRDAERRRARQAERARATTTPTTVPRDSPLPQTIDGHQARERVVYLPFQDIVAPSLLIRVLLRRVPRRRLPGPVQDRHDSAVNHELNFFHPRRESLRDAADTAYGTMNRLIRF